MARHVQFADHHRTPMQYDLMSCPPPLAVKASRTCSVKGNPSVVRASPFPKNLIFFNSLFLIWVMFSTMCFLFWLHLHLHEDDIHVACGLYMLVEWGLEMWLSVHLYAVDGHTERQRQTTAWFLASSMFNTIVVRIPTWHSALTGAKTSSWGHGVRPRWQLRMVTSSHIQGVSKRTGL